MTDKPRLIERAFPLKQASLDSVHEKNVRHGHISTLHIWPARRPLAACRAALIATLLPDPGTPEERKRLVERIGGTVVKKIERKKIGERTVEVEREETVGGVLHWGRESNPDMDWFRQEIRKAYGGRAPKLLDPFAGGGAIPLEAMRLGCEVTAADINPVAWFILKCTLGYPQKLAGQKRPLPDFVLKDREFMEAFFKAQGLKGAVLRTQLERLGLGESKEPLFRELEPGDPLLLADLAWHVRAWGRWVLHEARRDLAKYYPTYADFEPLVSGSRRCDKREPHLVPLKDGGTADVDALNAEFSEQYLGDKRNPRWVAKPTVAYLWARTLTCKNCRATIPLLKTRWLCKKDRERVLLAFTPNPSRSGVLFRVEHHVPFGHGGAAERRESDKVLGRGTMTRVGAWCPSCGVPGAIAMDTEAIRQAGVQVGLGAALTAVVVSGPGGKAYRLPKDLEVAASARSDADVLRAFEGVPFGVVDEPVPSKEAPGIRVPLYGIDTWRKLFTNRQLCALATFVRAVRTVRQLLASHGYDRAWTQSVTGELAIALDRLADRSSTICRPDPTPTQSGVINTFSRFALPMTWDFIESVTTETASGGFAGAVEWVAKVVEHCSSIGEGQARTLVASATQRANDSVDLVVTDPPYYGAIPYSDLMDFFYVWLRRVVNGASLEDDTAFRKPLGPKWNPQTNDGELIDDASRHGGDADKSKAAYEDGMFRAFQSCCLALKPEGRLVVVFAHKQPDAWETLVSAMIRAGFVVDASWPIQTEMGNRTRALSSAALSSSVWLVCKKRAESSRTGWDTAVLEEMRANIYTRLREFWDAGIRGPDFVWAATGPALEAYSKHPVVKKANAPGETLTVSEFLRAVRRIVVDFVVGRVLTRSQDGSTVSGLDDITTYYLLHRNDFGLNDAPAGACILYAVSCGLSDSALSDQWDILVRVGGQAAPDDGEDEADQESGEDEGEQSDGKGSRLKLKPWHQRRRATMGYDTEGRPAPLIDQIHRLMHLWKSGDRLKVDEYIDDRNLRKNSLFHQLLQALIELAPHSSEERSVLESMSNHLAARGAIPQPDLPLPAEEM